MIIDYYHYLNYYLLYIIPVIFFPSEYFPYLFEHIYNKYSEISYEESGDVDGKYSLTGTSQDAWVTVFIDNKDEGYRNFKIRYSAGGPGFGVILKKEEKHF